MNGQNDKAEQRKQRLAKALKANIAKRKTQAKTAHGCGRTARNAPKGRGLPQLSHLCLLAAQFGREAQRKG